jgi:hypothetical protein
MYTLQGKTRPTRHVRFPRQSMYAQRMLPAGGPRTWQPFIQPSIDLNRSTTPEKKGSRHNPQHISCLIRGSVPSFSPKTSNGAVGEKSNFCWQPTTRLTGPISPTCNRYVQYLLTRANRTILNWHRRGLKPWRCQLATYPLPDLPNQLSPLSPIGPVRSPV